MKNAESPRFELVLNVKNNAGVPTGKKKDIKTNDAAELEIFWNRHNPVRREPSKKRTKDTTNPEALRTILHKKLEKLKNLPVDQDDRKIAPLSVETIDSAKNIIDAFVDILRVHVKIIPQNTGSLLLELNSVQPEQALEITVADDEYSYNFWSTTDTKFLASCENRKIDRAEIRTLVENFNKGLK